jgi:hypothetical protein
MAEPRIVLEIDGQPVRMNRFVRSIFVNAILGMIRSLDDVAAEPRRVVFTIEREDPK